MPFARPTLAQIIERIKADIASNLGAQATTLRRALINILARALGGAVHLLYGFISYAQEQLFIDTAEEANVIRKASVYGIYRFPAEAATGTITITGSNGVNVPEGTAFRRLDGFRYFTTESVDISGGTGSVDVRAEIAGSLGNLASGTVVLESPITGVDNAATVSAVNPIDLGSDIETIEALKRRYLDRVQRPPQGGSKADYVSWAREIPNVGEVIVYGPLELSEDDPLATPLPPVGSVYVYINQADSDAAPSGALLAAVKANIDLKKPITALVEVKPLTTVFTPFSIKVVLNAGYSLSNAQDEIFAELSELFEEEGTPGRTIALSRISGAISRARSVSSFELFSPTTSVVLSFDEIGRVRDQDVTVYEI